MQLPHKKVLVGDSDSVVLALVAYILQRQGFAVDAVSDRDQILERMRDAVYDAIIVDLHIDGIRELIQAAPEGAKRIIVTTVLTDPHELPVHSTLLKPLEFGELVETIARVVNPEPELGAQ